MAGAYPSASALRHRRVCERPAGKDVRMILRYDRLRIEIPPGDPDAAGDAGFK
jgi:hypothetical protein